MVHSAQCPQRMLSALPTCCWCSQTPISTAAPRYVPGLGPALYLAPHTGEGMAGSPGVNSSLFRLLDMSWGKRLLSALRTFLPGHLGSGLMLTGAG